MIRSAIIADHWAVGAVNNGSHLSLISGGEEATMVLKPILSCAPLTTNKECGSGFYGKCEFEVDDVAKD